MKKLFLSLAIALGIVGCEKFLDVPPVNKLLEQEALTSPADYERLLNSCYDVTANYYNGRIQNLFELLGDNLSAPNNNSDYTEVYNRNMLFFNSTIGGVYGEPYISIFRINKLLERIDEIGFDPDRRIEIEAEARFLRAMGHFELVRGWAQPYGFTANNTHPGITIKGSTEAQLLPRNSVEEVYAFIIQDLKFAENNLSGTNGVYATSWAAKALLAKVYFQMNDYNNATLYAAEVINSGEFDFGSSTDRFVQNAVANEAIFSTISVSDPEGGNNDFRSGALVGNYRSDVGGEPTLRASKEYYDLIAGDTADARSAWVEVRNPGQANEYYAITKFNKEYFNVPVLHLTDMKLIRAESLCLLNRDKDVAIEDLNDILERAFGNSDRNLSLNNNYNEILEAVRRERRIEMLGEGDRVQDLKRRGAAGESILIRNSDWNCPGLILQFPVTERSDVFEMNQTGGC